MRELEGAGLFAVAVWLTAARGEAWKRMETEGVVCLGIQTIRDPHSLNFFYPLGIPMRRLIMIGERKKKLNGRKIIGFGWHL